MKGHATKSTFIKRKYCMEKEWKRCWKMLMNLFLKIRVSRSKNRTQKRTFLGATQSLQSTWTLKKGDDKNIHAEVAGEASWAHRTRMPYCCMNTMWATGGGALQYPSMMISWKKPPSSPVASVETLNTMDHTSQRIHNNIFADRVVRDKTGELQLNYSQPAWGEWWCRPHVGSESPKAPPAETDQCWLWVLEKSVKNLKTKNRRIMTNQKTSSLGVVLVHKTHRAAQSWAHTFFSTGKWQFHIACSRKSKFPRPILFQ